MKIFGFIIIRQKEYEDLVQAHYVRARVGQAYRWFSGWKDLDVIWDFLLNTSGKLIDRARDDYAAARKTDCYGNAK